ncbi:hypothetical protein ABJ885_003704 [Escherichia coli]|nr:hypothetical protein [Escherichia coli]EJQ6303381.1 hypothetical protein [Escherichia coli]EJR8210155.1 hypothetical protein [Escherichia coli]EKF2998869.1 hypothetical protein [Escherichia coli]EKI4979804.1 hypothetical protein [Escherichia coli]
MVQLVDPARCVSF